jgi:hypothetical protein
VILLEEIEEIADGRAIFRDVGVVFIGARIREIISAARGERLQVRRRKTEPV